jgi:hypothetical protein
VLEGILDHLACSIVEDEAGFVLANSVGQGILFLQARELNSQLKVQNN